MRRLVINADDFGWNEENDLVIMDMLLNMTISSVSVIVNGSNIMNVKKFYLENRKLSFGLHLNLTEGLSLTEQNRTDQNYQSSLVDINGRMLGKQGFRDALKQKIINISDIDEQIRLQLDKFIELFGQYPIQIDGHQHVHIIPIIASSIGRIMTQEYGIYKVLNQYNSKTRLIQEKLIYSDNFSNQQIIFYQEVIEQSKLSKLIYNKYKVFSCSHFMGINLMGQNLTLKNIQSSISTQESQSSDYTEWMCHPGKENELDKREMFYNSKDRDHEANIIKSNELKQILEVNNIQLISFKDITRPDSLSSKNIMIYSQMISGTGNFTTCLRIKSLLEESQFTVFLRNINSFNFEIEESCIREVENLITFCQQENIVAILGINMFRTGIILQRAFGEQSKIRIPYVLIIAGTDANIYIKDLNYKDDILKAIKNSAALISLNQAMIEIVNTELRQTNIQKDITLIPQSVTDEVEQIFSLKTHFNIPQDCSLSLLPASFRMVKDIIFILAPIQKLFQSKFQNHILLILGPILDKVYYNEVKIQVEKLNTQLGSRRIILGESIEHSRYIYSFRRDCNLLINTSLNEGVSSTILEALKYKIPVLARANEGNQSIIIDQQNGLLFNTQEDFQDCYTKLMTSENLVDSLKNNGYHTYTQNYSPQQEQQKLAQVMNQAIQL